MLSETLQGIKERKGRRWVLVLPIAITGGCLAWIVSLFGTLVAMPWTWDDDDVWAGDVGATVGAYTVIVLAAMVAPNFKRTTAAILSAGFLWLLYFCCTSNSDKTWSPVPFLCLGIASIALAL